MKPDFTLPPAPGRPLGEANIWITSIGISVGLIMIFGLLGIILVNGMEAFWPKTIHELTLSPAAEGEKPYTLYASITKDQTRHVPADPTQPGSTARDIREYQLFTGSKETYGQSYRYVDVHNISASSTPQGLLCLERMEGGKALVKPLELQLASGETIPASSPEFMQAFRRALDHETELREEIKAIDTGKIGTVNTRLADARLDIKAIERSYDIREENGTRTAALKQNPVVRDVDHPVEERSSIPWETGKGRRSAWTRPCTAIFRTTWASSANAASSSTTCTTSLWMIRGRPTRKAAFSPPSSAPSS